MLHEIERHAIHSNETLGVALNTVNAMLQQHARLLSRRNQDELGGPVVLYQTHQYMQFQYHMLENTRARSISIEQRSRNEINLVIRTFLGHPQTSVANHCKALNMVAQNQTRATALISEATQRDSAVMRTVAIVTMTFLPATFVTVCIDNCSPGELRAYGQ